MTNDQTGTELVPRPWQSDELTLMTGTLADLEASAADFRRYAETHEVTDKETCADMKEKIVAVKRGYKECEVAAHPVKKVILAASQWVQTKYNKAANAFEQTKGIMEKKVGDWEAKEERRTALEKQQEQERVNKKREEEAAAQLLKDKEAAAARKKERVAEIKALKLPARQKEKLLREAGAQEEADVEKAAADAFEHIEKTPEVTVESNKPKVSGTIARKNYSAKCLNRRAFIDKFVNRYLRGELTQTIVVKRPDGKEESIYIDWMEYINVSDAALSKTAREVKDTEMLESTFPGVKGEEHRSY